jgi:uncharacterized protein (TIGR02217 family)
MSNFINERLLEYMSYGFEGGPTFLTTSAELVSGWDQRNAERSRPRHRYVAQYDAISKDFHDLLKSAYVACLGPVASFRLKDWSDYKLDDEQIGISDGTTDQAIQIIKPYTFGVTTIERPITKPCDSTVWTQANGYVEDAVPLVVTADDTPITPTSIDYDTGIITITEAAGQVIRATCHFDVPVHFEEDSLNFTIVEYEAHNATVSLIEDFRP